MIDYIQVFGLQCSGTNAIMNLLEANFDVTVGGKYGAKHGLKLRVEEGKDYSNVLFLYIHKDIFAWVCSVKDTPHGAVPFLPISKVIRHVWETEAFCFSNIIKMRKKILQDFRKIENQVAHWENLKHLWLFSNPQGLLRALQQKYSLPVNSGFPDVSRLEWYKGKENRPGRHIAHRWRKLEEKRKYYTNRAYMNRLSQNDIDFIKGYATMEERQWLKI